MTKLRTKGFHAMIYYEQSLTQQQSNNQFNSNFNDDAFSKATIYNSFKEFHQA